MTPQIEMVGLDEIAERLDRSRGTVDSWRHRGWRGFPDQAQMISGRPVWYWSQIERWYAKVPKIYRPRDAVLVAPVGEWGDLPNGAP